MCCWRKCFQAARPSPKKEEGIAAVEMALVLPLFLLLVTGLCTLGHAMIIRYVMNTAAYAGARECGLRRTLTPSCIQQVVDQEMGAFASACARQVRATSTVSSNPGATGLPFTTVNTLQVDLTCDFTGGVGLGFLQRMGILNRAITVRASMPF